MAEQEATINPDGTTTFQDASDTAGDAGFDGTQDQGGASDGQEGFFEGDDANMPPVDVVKGIDPAIYLITIVVIIAGLYYYFFIRNREKEEDPFFSNLDGEKFNVKLPAEVDEYYKIKAKCEEAGWEPGTGPPGGQDSNANGPHRVLAQALMKRAIADIPLVMYIQKESSGMSKLYSKSMCSVKQWKSYQHAENLVSNEVNEVKAEADEIEPGWSDVIWRQATQYHGMLKKRHEMEAQAAAEKAKQQQGGKPMSKAEEAKAKEQAAERAAQELIKEEEREKNKEKNNKAFKSGVKKGFLDKGKKK